MGRSQGNEEIIILTLDFPPSPGGIQTSAYNTCIALQDEPLIVLAPYVSAGKDFDRQQNFRIIRPRLRLFNAGRWGKLFYLLWSFFIIFKLSLRRRIKIILCSHVWSGFPAAFLYKLKRTPYIVFTHALEIMDENSSFFVKKILRTASYVICYSEFTKERIIDLGIKQEKIKKLFPAVNLNAVESSEQERNNLKKRLNIGSEKIILTVARFYDYKGIDMVIEALPYICRSIDHIKYIILGFKEQADINALRGRARRLNVADRIIFLESDMDYRQVLKYFDLCDIFIMASRKIVLKRKVLAEGLGIVFLEANAFGKPVIGGNSGGIPDAVVDGVTGILVNPLDPKEIADAAIKLLRDEGLARRLGENGKRRVRQEFNIELMHKRLKEIIDLYV